MSVTLNLKPQQEAGLLARAEASGVTVEEFLISIVDGVVNSTSAMRTPEQRAAAFEKWPASHRETPPLSDFAVSREAMYQDRDAQ